MKAFKDYTAEDFQRLDSIRKTSWFKLSKEDKKFKKEYYLALKNL